MALEGKIKIIKQYLEDVAEGKRKYDKEIMKVLQEIIGRLPGVMNDDFRRVMSGMVNDNYL